MLTSERLKDYVQGHFTSRRGIQEIKRFLRDFYENNKKSDPTKRYTRYLDNRFQGVNCLYSCLSDYYVIDIRQLQTIFSGNIYILFF